VKRRIAVGCLWAFGLFSMVANYAPVFTLDGIRVEGQAANLEDDIKALLVSDSGSNLMQVDLDSWARDIVAMPAIRSARTYVTVFGEAVARVDAAVPVGLVDTNPVAGVSASGVVLPIVHHSSSERIPIITGIGGRPAYYGTTVGSQLLCALKFLSTWKDKQVDESYQLAEIHIGAASEVSVYLWPSRLYVQFGRGNWNQQIAMLWPVLKRLPLSEQSLDMRFAGQVVETL
jgi:hypothetical protein